MNLNVDFVNPKDAAMIRQASSYNFFSNEPLTVREYPRAIIGTGWENGGVWQENGEFLTHSFFNSSPLFPMEKAPNPAQIVDESVVFVGLFTGTWGHEITDHLKHLWFYFDERYAHLKNLRFLYSVVKSNRSPTPNFLKMLQTIGFPTEKLELLEKNTQFKSVFVPDDCFLWQTTPTARFAQMNAAYTAILKRLPALPPLSDPAPQKVYFSRVSFKKSGYEFKDFNEIEIENFFKNQGFTIFHPEQHTFLEELAVLQHCNTFATTEGSISHNLLFCKDGTTALILKKCNGHIASHQMPINAFKNAQVTYIDAAFSPIAERSREWFDGPFFLYESNALRHYFGLPPKMFPFLKYLKHLFVYIFICKRGWFSWHYIDHRFLGRTHAWRAKLQIGTRLRRFLKKS